MDEAKLKRLIEQIMHLTPKGFLENTDSGEEMTARMREAAANLWRAFKTQDTTRLDQRAAELEGQVLAAQSIGRLSEREAIQLLDQLHELAP